VIYIRIPLTKIPHKSLPVFRVPRDDYTQDLVGLVILNPVGSYGNPVSSYGIPMGIITIHPMEVIIQMGIPYNLVRLINPIGPCGNPTGFL